MIIPNMSSSSSGYHTVPGSANWETEVGKRYGAPSLSSRSSPPSGEAGCGIHDSSQTSLGEGGHERVEERGSWISALEMSCRRSPRRMW